LFARRINLTWGGFNLLKMKSINLNITFQQYNGLNDLNELDKTLCGFAEQALATSYSPYSKFRVGTAIRLSGGEIILGSNQENVAYPSGLCAERVALFSIGSNHPNAVIQSMAITAQTDAFEILQPVTSCGGCLQVMVEFERRQKLPIEVIFYCINGEILKVPSVKSLLPFAFVEERLEG
jgi:cytidine deaminase